MRLPIACLSLVLVVSVIPTPAAAQSREYWEQKIEEMGVEAGCAALVRAWGVGRALPRWAVSLGCSGVYDSLPERRRIGPVYGEFFGCKTDADCPNGLTCMHANALLPSQKLCTVTVEYDRKHRQP